MAIPTYTIACRWDDEAKVWHIAESDVPGLSTGADTLDELLSKLKVMIPELLELNDELPPTPDIRFIVHADTRVAA